MLCLIPGCTRDVGQSQITELRCGEHGVVNILSRPEGKRTRYSCEIVDQSGKTIAAAQLGMFNREEPRRLFAVAGKHSKYVLFAIPREDSQCIATFQVRGDLVSSWENAVLASRAVVLVDFDALEVSAPGNEPQFVEEAAELAIEDLNDSLKAALLQCVTSVVLPAQAPEVTAQALGKLPNLKSITSHRALSNREVEAINQCGSIGFIYLDKANLEESDLTQLKELKLNAVHLREAGSGQAVAPSIQLPSDGLSDAAVTELQEALPNTEVYQLRVSAQDEVPEGYISRWWNPQEGGD